MKWVHVGSKSRDDESGKSDALMAQLQLLGNGLISGEIGGVEVIQKAAALADHFEEAAARAVVFDVFLQMLGQVIDPLGEQGHLHIRRPGVALMNLKALYRLAFFHSLSVKYFRFKESV